MDKCDETGEKRILHVEVDEMAVYNRGFRVRQGDPEWFLSIVAVPGVNTKGRFEHVTIHLINDRKFTTMLPIIERFSSNAKDGTVTTDQYKSYSRIGRSILLNVSHLTVNHSFHFQNALGVNTKLCRSRTRMQ